MQGLNPQQKAAVTHLGSPLLVLAGAGTGKTRVITEKIAWLIRSADIPAHEIVAITFTNKAAKEMTRRAGKLLSKTEGKGLNVSTFHTLGLRILRQEAHTLGYGQNLSIFDANDSERLIRQLSKASNPEDAKPILQQISSWKNRFISPEEALEQAGKEQELHSALVYQQYQAQIKAYNAVDFDDLIALPTTLFENDQATLDRWQSKLKYFLVDEYQDTNACQYRFIQLLLGLRTSLTCVGDDDQSIYAWRGARSENIHLLQQDFPNLKVIKLEQNYRSTSRILESANQLISNNPHVYEKKLWSGKGEGEKITVMAAKNAQNEAEKVISEIIKAQFHDDMQPKDMAILYRSNHQGKLFEKLLREQNIPYRLSGGTGFFDRTEVKDILSYLKLIANPEDDAAFLRIVNTPRREIGASTLEKLSQYAKTRGKPLSQCANEVGLESHITAKGRQRLATFSYWLENIIETAKQDEPVNIVRQLLQDIDYQNWLIETAKNEVQAEKQWANVQEVLSWIKRLQERDGKAATLSHIVGHMSLVDLLERQEDDSQDNRVTLMTIHAAKGLEFPCVYLVGMEEALLPHANSLATGDIEEERRLAYVGITRAQSRLTLSYAKTRRRAGELEITEPSRFLDELPETHLHHLNSKTATPEDRAKTADAYMAQINAMFDQ